ncbi:MAG: V-type ATP synthase subunit D [Thermoplasmata archaeon]|nr:V-type ATP synthase subunit D [Thermoplasmata archaeon]MBE3138120.1 V-type ATP synthase subunit D [Thermoplasmata archaeon]MBE3139836.1 V-type ATP synthase subunit D [Thermoplasmata archaeon]
MTEQILEDVNPTRMDLLETRKKLALARKGYTLLEEKRDTLVEKLFGVITKRSTLKQTIDTGFHDAFFSLLQAQMLLGEQQVNDASQLTPPAGEIDLEPHNIMGVKIPKLNKQHLQHPTKPRYSFLETCASLDDAYKRFNDLLIQMVELAELEGIIKSLSVEIEKTKRRVNVLEHTLIPRLLATIKYIEMQLEEREREDFFRRKRIKALLEAKKSKYVH